MKEEQAVVAEKPMMRLVVFGESAAMGDPEPGFGLARMLEVLLERRLPERKVEVVNAAMTAISSHVIRVVGAEMRPVPASAWIIYAGNNEVVGPFGPGTVFGERAAPQWWARGQAAARATRTGQWIQDVGERRAESAGRPRTWRGMEMFLEAQVSAEAPSLARVQASFEANMREMVALSTRQDPARVLIMGAAAVNLRDSPPFVGVSPEEMAAWRNEPGALRSGGEPLTLAELRQRWQDRPTEAESAWRLARALLDTPGGAEEAAALFRRACELDMLRFRCDPALQSRMKSAATSKTARRPGVIWVDPQARLDALADDGVADDTFFYEHVHLTPRGAYEVARLYAEALGGPDGPAWPTLDECLQRLGHTPWHERQTLKEMRARLRRPPFSHQRGAKERDDALGARLDDLSQSLTPERLKSLLAECKLQCAHHPHDWMLRRQTAALAESTGEHALAVALLTDAATLMPHHTSDHLLGAALNRAGRPADAIPRLRAALAARPEYAQAWNSLGIALAHTSETAEAENAFAQAVVVVPDFAEAYRNWAMVCALRGETGRALEKLRLAHAAEPEDIAIRNDLGRSLVAASQFAEAWPHYAAVAAALPRDVNAQLNAAMLLTKLNRQDDAIPYFERLLAIDPTHPHARQALGK